MRLMNTLKISSRSTIIRLIKGLVITVSMSLSSSLFADQLRIAVASNFIGPMQQIKQAFEKQSSHRLSLHSASTGKLYAQIKHGAPFDAFFSADKTTSERLIREGEASSEHFFTYARGQLVVLTSLPYQDLSKILAASKRIAIANPKLAPYGQASQTLLENLNLWTKNQNKYVMGESIAQTLHFTLSQNAQTGFVGLSQALYAQRLGHSSRLNMLSLPHDLYDDIQQTAVILQRSQFKSAVKALFDFIQQPNTQRDISRFGYLTQSPLDGE